MFSGITETFEGAFLDHAANVALLMDNCAFNEDFEVQVVGRSISGDSSTISCRISRADGFAAELLTRVKLEIEGDNLCMTTNTRYRNYLDVEEMVVLAHLANKLIEGTEELVGEYIHSDGTIVHVFGAEVDRCILDAPPADIQPFFIDLMKRVILSGCVFLGFIAAAEPAGAESFVSRYDYSLDDEDIEAIADLLYG